MWDRDRGAAHGGRHAKQRRRIIGIEKGYHGRTGLSGAIGDNEVGRLLEDLMLQGGVGLDYMVWKPADDVGRAGRSGGQRASGLYFEVREEGVPRDPLGWLAKR